MTPPVSPASRRERPAKPALTKEGIIDAAMAIVTDPDGPSLTLRRLAERLDTGPASLYVYIRNITELNALLLDRLLADLDTTWSASEPWRPRLHRALLDYSVLLARYPTLARTALLVWPDGPSYLDLLELLMRLLEKAGVDDAVAVRSVDLLLQLATASAVEWSGRSQADGQDLDDLGATLAAADGARRPTLVRVGADAFVSGDPDERHRWVIDALLDGILAARRP